MNHIELIHHINHYARTGIIDDALIPSYDQTGRWQGDSIPLIKSAQRAALSSIRKSLLPVSRRTTRSRSGTILRTSFVWRRENPVTITYCEIRGDVTIFENASVHATGLRHVGGRFIANNCTRLYLPHLTSVSGSFEAMHGYSLKVPRLLYVGGDLIVVGHVPPRIETVGGRFGVYWLFDVEAPRLRSVGGAFVAPKAEMVAMPVLEKIGGGFLLSNMARRVQAPRLTFVGGDFLADAVRNLRAPRLRVVGGNLDTRSAIDYYHPDVRVAGEWTPHPDACVNWQRRESARQALKGHTGPIFL
ncbi:MAG: hypothetical protein Q8Q59_09400 [Luteolibacter sp.]|nr:hypothetical protein [Luteolibacter sp.]